MLIYLIRYSVKKEEGRILMDKQLSRVKRTRSVDLEKRTRDFVKDEILPVVNNQLSSSYRVRKIWGPGLFSAQVVGVGFAVVKNDLFRCLRHGVIRIIVGPSYITLVVYSTFLDREEVLSVLGTRLERFAERYKLTPEIETYLD